MMNTTEMLHSTSSDYSYDYGDEFAPCNIGSAEVFGESFLPALYSLVFVFGLPGNALVLWILLKYKLWKNMTDIYLLNLALSDLLFIISLPFWAYFVKDEWILGNAFCKIINAAYLLGYYGGILFITLISIDRYLAIVHAVFSMKARTFRYGIISSIIMWCIAIIASLPTMIYNKVENIEGRNVCHTFFPTENFLNWKLYTLFKANVLGFFVPLIIMFFCYIRILQILLKNKSNKKHRAIKVLFTVVIVFFVFWTPHNIVMFLQSLRELNVLNGCEVSIKLAIAQQVTETIAFVHCCLNPVIYVFMGERFRMYLCRLFHSCLPPVLRCKAGGKLHFSSRDFTASIRSQSTGDHESSTIM
ncbi:C-C chemokine receptor type 4-like [Heterodontus francisci]|uniref:C-C chemokine receptor type 4-like n=1 Tax=Heterodontus francisci TaxID=7792 RepID=UPI00355C6F6B